jgi:hypothetical protein
MDHMTFMTIFSLLATVGMVLVILWSMSTGDPQGQDKRPGSSHLQYEPRMGMIQEFVQWDSTRVVPQEYAFQPSLEVAYRKALKNVKRPNHPSI